MKTESALPPNLNMFLDVPVGVTVRLGSCQLSMKEVLQLNPGALIELDRMADSPVDLLVNDKLVARGEVVVVDNKFGLKITELVGA